MPPQANLHAQKDYDNFFQYFPIYEVGMMAMFRLSSLLLLFVLLILCCNSTENGAMIGDEAPQQTQLPKIKVNLPPPPSFKKDHPPESYPDSSFSVYGLRKNIEKKINTQVRVKGFLIGIYECPECAKGSECPPCLKPHFWIADRANTPKEQALMVTDYPKEDPKTRKKLEFQMGAQYFVSGTFSKSSATGFADSNGLLMYSESSLLTDE
jgi:hypothetical protein